MKVICDRSSLHDAINLISAVVPTRTPRLQLTCVKLIASAEEGSRGLTLAATDMEVSLRLTTVNVEIAEPGEALVPAQKLQQIVAAEDADSTLTLQGADDTLEVRGADATFKIYGQPIDEFPPIGEFPTDGETRCVFEIAAPELRRLITRTIFATARETSRYAINGVLLKVKGRKLEMVATDGRRLALARGVATNAPDDNEMQCIIPSKSLSLAVKLLTSDDTVRIAITENHAVFAFHDGGDTPRAILSTSLVEGAFPPYDDVIPSDQDKKATFNVSSLQSGVRRAALLTNEESRGVRLRFGVQGDDPKTKTLRLTSRAPEMGESRIDVEVASYIGDEIEIGFNPSFITDALKVLDDEQVVIELKSPNKPGLVRAGSDFLYVVMPVSLQ